MDTIRPWLAIGDSIDVRQPSLLRLAQIDAMLLLAEEIRYPAIDTYFLPIPDAEPIPAGALPEGLAYIRAQREAGRKVLVACAAGISRSATFCVAALKEAEGLSLVDAYRVVRQHHPIAGPHPELWISLCAYYPDEPPYSDLWAQLIVKD